MRDCGDHTRVEALLEESVALHCVLGDTGGVALALANRGHLAYQRHDPGRAALLCAESVRLYRTLPAAAGHAYAILMLGLVAGGQGAPARGRALVEEGLALYREAGDSGGIGGIATALHYLARLARVEGNLPRPRPVPGEPGRRQPGGDGAAGLGPRRHGWGGRRGGADGARASRRGIWYPSRKWLRFFCTHEQHWGGDGYDN